MFGFASWRKWGVCGSAGVAVFFCAASAWAQAPAPPGPAYPPGAIYAPFEVSNVESSISTIQRGTADILRSVGLMESFLGDARIKNTIAYKQALENKVHEVDTFWTRKFRYLEYRDRFYPPFAVRQAQLAKMKAESAVRGFILPTDGELSPDLNWLRTEISKLRISSGLRNGVSARPGSTEDVVIPSFQFASINFTNTRGLKTFPLGQPLNPLPWPFLLNNPRDPQLPLVISDVNQGFQAVREAKIRAPGAQGAELDPLLVRDAEERLKYGMAQLDYIFKSRFTSQMRIPPDERGFTDAEWTQANRFIIDLKKQVHQLTALQGQVEQSEFDGDGRIIEVVDFMDQNSLKFAKPSPGGEGTYEFLYFRLLAIYQEYLAHDGLRQVSPGDSLPGQAPPGPVRPVPVTNPGVQPGAKPPLPGAGVG